MLMIVCSRLLLLQWRSLIFRVRIIHRDTRYHILTSRVARGNRVVAMVMLVDRGNGSVAMVMLVARDARRVAMVMALVVRGNGRMMRVMVIVVALMTTRANTASGAGGVTVLVLMSAVSVNNIR